MSRVCTAIRAHTVPWSAIGVLTHAPARRAAAWAFVVLAVAGAIGWLYLLRAIGVVPYGPVVAGALPLQQLDGSDAQPLLRIAVAWIPAGALAGLGLDAAGSRGQRGAAGVAAVATIILMSVGAVSDAATISGPVASHVTPQLSRPGTWVAVAFMTLGVLLISRACSRRGRPPARA